MDLYTQSEIVKSKEDLIAFIHSLQVDLYTNPKDWENPSLENFLEAMGAWMTESERLTDKPDWNSFAQILLAAKIYE